MSYRATYQLSWNTEMPGRDAVVSDLTIMRYPRNTSGRPGRLPADAKPDQRLGRLPVVRGGPAHRRVLPEMAQHRLHPRVPR